MWYSNGSMWVASTPGFRVEGTQVSLQYISTARDCTQKNILFHHRGIQYPTLKALLTVEGRIMGAIGRNGTQRSYKAVSESTQAYKDLRKGTLNSWEPSLQAEYSSTSLHERRSIHGANTRYSESSTLQPKSRHSKCSPRKLSKTKQKSSAALLPPPYVKHGL